MSQATFSEAFFDEVLDRLGDQPPDVIPIGSSSLPGCDIDGDGDCDTLDFESFQNALGSCRGQPGYHPLADGDADGCVTPEDRQYLFPEPPKD